MRGGGTLPDAQGHDLKLSYSRTTLKTVADAITQQVGIVFSYEIALADYPMENLYVTEQGAALDAILKTVFTPRGIDYRVVDKVVVLTRSAHPAQTVRAAPAKAQVTGVVRDAAGNPMIGVTVTVKGTLVGVSTGVDGSYTIPADKDAMLLFSYIGYRNQEEPVGQRTQIDVTMQEDQLMMDEVVVVGYGTLKKRNIVGAVENLAGDAVENRPNADITREQLVTMMYRYAGSPKADGKLDSFSDAASVSSYAVNAMQWAVANGIVNGSNGKLNPQNNATRAEVAAILMRFCEMSK